MAPIENNGGRPVRSLGQLHLGNLLATTLKPTADLKKQRPDLQSLGVCRVINVDYEDFFVSLRTVIGTGDEFVRVPVPLTFPAAGCRHFLGAMPQIGDYCVVGWMPQESKADKQGTKTPVILSWVVPGVWPGREWSTMAAFEQDEFDTEDPKIRHLLQGVFDPIRHKLRHANPGNIVGSSAQGADLVLDEGVTLASRRGSEFRLRDQDGAIVSRSLQQFHAMSGARIYGGMVQRDATFLAAMMVSDGFVWDDKIQSLAGSPVHELDLNPDSKNPDGFLTPAKHLRRSRQTDGTLGRAGLPLEPHLDPYEFLRRGGFIDSSGMVVDDRHVSDAYYGGKAMYRVSSGSAANAILDPDAPTLTEYRVEVAHTSDGRLPVTEQTDMFDAERLPEQEANATRELPPNVPFIESVMGSVVGNDPFSQTGRANYGLPMKAVIFEGDRPVPRLEAIPLPTDPDHKERAVPVAEQAATLFRLTPPLGGLPDTFWSVNKKGQVKMSVGGAAAENSVEAYLRGGLKLGIGGQFQLLMDGHIQLRNLSKASMELVSDQGPVTIYGGGSLKGAQSIGERAAGSERGEADVPAVSIEARTNLYMKAGKTTRITANEVELKGPSVHVSGSEEVSLDAVKRLGLSAETYNLAVSGKAQESFTGPKGQLPTNGALHERTYTAMFPGHVCEKVEYTQGDREEKFTLGDHTTTILIGDMTYKVLLGDYSIQATTSQLKMGSSGIKGTALVGTVSLTAVAGAVTMSGMTGITMLSAGGPAVVKSTTSVYLGAPITGPDAGPILCAGSKEPFTNIPFAVLGTQGAKAHIVGP